MDITIIRTSSHGDIVLTEPIFEALKKIGYHTNLITKKEYYPLVKYNPYIDNVIFAEGLKNIKTDILVDLQRNPLSYRLRTRIKADKVKKVNKYYLKRFLYVNFHKKIQLLPVILRYKESVDLAIGRKLELNKLRFFPATDITLQVPKPFITLALSSKWYTKSYPFVEDIIRMLINKTKFNIIYIGKNEINFQDNRFYNLGEKYPIDTGAAIIKDSVCMLTVDSLWMHIGVGLNIKTFALFGSTTPQLGFVSPYNMPTKIIETNLDCRPCTKIGKKKCPKGHFKCMRNITPSLIWNVIKNECNS